MMLTSEQNYPPILTRFGIALVTGIAGYWLIGLGHGLIRRGRRRSGYALVWIGWLGFAVACGLLFLTSYRWSWDWWL